MGHAFSGTNLSDFDIIEGADFFFKDDLLMNKAKTALIYFIPNEKIKMIILPGSVERIGDYAFQYAEHLRKVFIPEGVFTKIEYAAFEGCKLLKRVTLPSTSEIMEDNCFSGCNKILCGRLFKSPTIVERAKEVGIQSLPLFPRVS